MQKIRRTMETLASITIVASIVFLVVRFGWFRVMVVFFYVLGYLCILMLLAMPVLWLIFILSCLLGKRR